ncbi:folylpolyglutamate synthase/dihydrofolate synthase family protein [Sphingomonas sp. LY160]|nr:folylpolyglutamate synthase/dihydrofolate synthase family protein [Sphingomonas sp. LY160]MEA1073049.1 folylpolyglutamate synthase/dihydrofolate synthase family protein [Sphingomonas sp. LY160]
MIREVVRVTDPRLVALLARQATQAADGDQLGLQRITALFEKLGRPQDRLPPVFHVAGTNGKGSTSAFLRAALEAAGHQVHAFTSPHLVRYNERIRLAGRLIDDDLLAVTMSRVLDANDDIGASLFEVNTAAAFLAFSETPADACIVEVGLGGRLDATNVIERPLMTAITSLGLDHQGFLGNRLTDIAAEKAGIAKPGVPLVTMRYPTAVGAVVARVAAEAGALVIPRGTGWDVDPSNDIRYRDKMGTLTLPLPRLPGRHQLLNAALAVAILRHQNRLAVPESAMVAAMGWAQWPARLQQLNDGPLLEMLPPGSELWIDGGHNPSASRIIADHAARQWDDGLPLVLLFASLKAKDAKGVLAPFRGIAKAVRTLPIEGHDCRSPDELVAIATASGLPATAHQGLADALTAQRSPARVLVFGSLYLAGEALTLNGSAPD